MSFHISALISQPLAVAAKPRPMAGVQLGRNTGTLAGLSNCRDAKLNRSGAPVIQAAEHSAASDTGDTDPVEIVLYRTETF